jgi:hypothetical protein
MPAADTSDCNQLPLWSMKDAETLLFLRRAFLFGLNQTIAPRIRELRDRLDRHCRMLESMPDDVRRGYPSVDLHCARQMVDDLLDMLDRPLD